MIENQLNQVTETGRDLTTAIAFLLFPEKIFFCIFCCVCLTRGVCNIAFQTISQSAYTQCVLIGGCKREDIRHVLKFFMYCKGKNNSTYLYILYTYIFIRLMLV